MTGLTKAYLAEITSGNRPTELTQTRVHVQFNPSSLRVQLSNRTAGGRQAGAQARQRPGTGEVQVTFDLVFDTADEGTSENGVDVLEKTKTVERFVRPRSPQAGGEAPPRVVFVWGSFLVQGTMESATIDLDLFDSKGVPLRAKVAVSITGQDPRWTYTPRSNEDTPADRKGTRSGPDTSLPPGAPGTQGHGLSPDRIVQAMPGESLAQLAARTGFAPSDWRALADGLANPLKLELGQEVPLPPSAGKGAATGMATQGNEPARTAANLPLVNSVQATASGEGSNDSARSNRRTAGDPVRQGLAVASQGGLRGAIAQVKSAAHQQGAFRSLFAFGLGSAATADAGDRPWGSGDPLRPSFGSRRGPADQAGGSMRPGAQGSSLASAPPLHPARMSRVPRCRSGCGCRDCQGRHQR